MFFKPKIGLALGGGGARGLAHLGVLKILEQEKIPFHLIAGTSAGALIGAMYAFNPDVDKVEHKLRKFIFSQEFKKLGINHFIKRKEIENTLSHFVTYLKERLVINLAHSRTSLVNNKKFLSSSAEMLEDADIENSKIKFGAVACDLISGKDILFTSGDLVQAVTASSSLPGFLPPLKYLEYLLLDGCIIQPVPVKAAHNMGANIVIAVDVGQDVLPQNEFDNILDIMARTNLMTGHALNESQLEKADIVIKPDVGQFHWSEFEKMDYFIEQGKNAARSALWDLKKITRRRFRKKMQKC